MRYRSAAILALCGLLGAVGAASAQSVVAPGGQAPATAPGGLEGLDGPRNIDEAIRSGEVVVPPPGQEAISRDPAGSPGETVRPRR